MTSSIQTLCNAVKKIIWQIKPQADGFSFLILTGKMGQGKKTLMRQSHFQHTIAEGDVSTDIYYNPQGIILDLSEAWLHQSKTLLLQTLKQLNNCHSHIKINGIILCVDINELTPTDPIELSANIKTHSEILQRFGTNLGYRIDVAVIFTRLDALAGFCDFYQYEHASELSKPLGFSLTERQDKDKLEKNFKLQFDQFIESLNQQVLNKVHPARSSIKRTLIREFPLQLASLKLGLQSLIVCFPAKLFRVQSLFFTSAEQGGVSVDQLNKKIQPEYGLSIPNTFPLSNNYRAYFIQGALTTCQEQMRQYGLDKKSFPKGLTQILAGVALLSFGLLTYYHFKSTRLLDEASKEWLAYDASTHQHNGEIAALYHLATASSTLDKLNSNLIAHDSIEKLKTQLENNRAEHLHGVFIPRLLKQIEGVLANEQQPHSLRYQALKVYLMFGEPQYFQPDAILAWFKAQGPQTLSQPEFEKKLTAIRLALKPPFHPVSINQQLVSTLRNYLNALPVSYLYYSIAKNSFSSETTPLEIKGFTLADKTLPYYFTKPGFHDVLKQLPDLAGQLSHDNWVLDRPTPDNLHDLLVQAYSYDYVLWWKNFAQKTAPLHAQTYQEVMHLAQLLRQSNAFEALVKLIQEHTSPDLGESSTEFNQHIANQFTDINLINNSAVTPLTHTLNEMEKFLTSISIVNDQGKTAFTITKSRFQGDALTNPLSILFNQSEQLPEPVASWTKQIASDTWFIFINDSKQYINTQWKNTVYQDYVNTIAKRFPFDQLGEEEVAISSFNAFFSNHGRLNTFVEEYIKPFLNTSEAQWKPKEMNNYVLPISSDTINEIMRANVITNMFFRESNESTQVEFSLQKSDLDPVVASLQLVIGKGVINDTQNNKSFTRFKWPTSNAKLTISTIEGKRFTLDEAGVWAFFKLLQKVDVQPDAEDTAQLQVLFEINGNSGRYLLKTQNEMNPFTPGILNGFNLSESIA